MRSLTVPAVLLLFLSPLASASTITVNGLGDSQATDGICTLREAITNVNNHAATWPDCAAGTGSDIINLPAGTITLAIAGHEDLNAAGDLDVLASVTINGDPAGSTVNGAGLDRVFDFNPAQAFMTNPPITVTLNNFTITGGSVAGDGGGFRVDAFATVNANGMTITGNSSPVNDGGGVKVEGNGTLTMVNSTISGNTTDLLYGGLRSDGTTTLTNCTVTNNSNSGLTTATRGNGLGGSGITLRNTIVAGNGSGGPDTEGGFTSNGYNIIGNLGIGTTITTTTGDQFGVTVAQVNLGPLQNNGGPTFTHALLSPSIAIDKGDSSGSTTDQRGQPRPCDDVTISNAPGGDGADIGAFELQGCVKDLPPVAVDDSAVVLENSSGNVIDVLANDSDADGDPLTVFSVGSPAHGSTVNNTTSVSYTPAPSFFGSDSFTYTIHDSHGSSATATVHITVNSPPHANPDSYSVNQDTTLTVAAPGVLGNDSDPDGDAIHAVLVSNPTHGTVSLNMNGSFTYIPNPGFACTDSFTYKANDGLADSNVAAVTINVIDTQPPAITAAVTVPLLWPANHDLVNVGFTFSTTDNGCGAVATGVAVFSDEADVVACGQPDCGADSNFSPDARGSGSALRLRAERPAANGANGRVYLIRVAAKDSSGNTSNSCVPVVVPKSQSAADISSVHARAQTAAAQCSATGMPPSGFVTVGSGPVVGPKQ